MHLLASLLDVAHYGVLALCVFGGPCAAARRSRTLLFAHILLLLLILVHWATNDGKCALTECVARLRNVPHRQAQTLPLGSQTYLVAMYVLIGLSAALLVWSS